MDATLTPSDHWRRPKRKIVIPEHVAERAGTRYEVDKECWISTYSVASHGYAQIGWQPARGSRFTVTAHRAAWVHHSGAQIPDGMTVDHLCKNRRCVNPDHLRLLANFENARRTGGRDWPLGECANGHPNSHLVRVNGGRKWACGVCHREQVGRANRKRAKTSAQKAV